MMTHVSNAFCTALTNKPTPADVTATFDPTASEGCGINTAASAGEGMKNLLDIGCSCPDALVDRSGGSRGLFEDAMFRCAVQIPRVSLCTMVGANVNETQTAN